MVSVATFIRTGAVLLSDFTMSRMLLNFSILQLLQILVRVQIIHVVFERRNHLRSIIEDGWFFSRLLIFNSCKLIIKITRLICLTCILLLASASFLTRCILRVKRILMALIFYVTANKQRIINSK